MVADQAALRMRADTIVGELGQDRQVAVPRQEAKGRAGDQLGSVAAVSDRDEGVQLAVHDLDGHEMRRGSNGQPRPSRNTS